MRRWRVAVLHAALTAVAGYPAIGFCQEPPSSTTTQPTDKPSPPLESAEPTGSQDVHSSAEVQVPSTADRSPAASRRIYTVPAGTKVLLQLRSAINTKSAKPGDAVYLASTFPVVVGARVLIPSGVYVQGIVDTVTRAGRVKGRAQLNLHFTSIIFPNGTVVEVPGIINSLPGSSKRTVDSEGKVTEQSNKGHDVAEAAKIGLEGAGIGTIGGAATGHPLEGAAIGGLSGVAVGAVVALFTRGDDINIENGTPVEMVLQRPLLLEDANLTASGSDGAISNSPYVPSSTQARPLEKPASQKSKVICPPGGLGCS